MAEGKESHGQGQDGGKTTATFGMTTEGSWMAHLRRRSKAKENKKTDTHERTPYMKKNII